LKPGDRPVESFQMDVLASPETLDFVRARGGQLYVWLHKGG
jgi:hypothetical protein